MALEVNGSPEDISKLIQKGIATEFEKLIRAELEAVVSPIVSELARKLADATAVRVQTYTARSSETFEPMVQVALMFNNKEVVYEARRDSQGRSTSQETPSDG